MPRPRNEGAQRWDSPTYRTGYVESVNGIAHTRIGGFRRTTGLRFVEANKKKVVEILDARIAAFIENPDTAKGGVMESSRQRMTLHDAIKEFVETPTFLNAKEGVQRWYRRGWTNYLPTNLPMNRKRIYQQINARRTELSNYDDQTVRKFLQYLNKFFDWCVEEEYLDRNPIKKSEIPKLKKYDKHPYTEDEASRIINYFMQRDDLRQMGLYLQLLNLTAMRPNEALIIKRQHVSESQIAIHGKGDEWRYFPLNVDLFRPVKELLDEIMTYETSNDRLFPWNTYTDIGKKVQEVKKHLSIRDVDAKGHSIQRRLHAFRKTAEWRWEKVFGLSTRVITDLAGHSEAVHRKHYRTQPTASEMTDAISRDLGPKAGRTRSKKR